MPESVSLNADAFSSGQISSKIWMCQQLETAKFLNPQIIWIYGGWYGLSGFLLLSRRQMPIKHIRSFDIDEESCQISDKLCENWVWQDWQYKAFKEDCNRLNFADLKYGPVPDIIVNTSTEHFKHQQWFDNILSGTLLVLQSNNMPHQDHFTNHTCLDDFVRSYPLINYHFIGQLDFNYPTWSFSRYMIIGNKI